MEQQFIEQRKSIVLDFIKSKEYKPMKFKEIAAFLQVPKEERKELKLVLEILVNEGEITIDVKGKFKKADSDIKIGVYCGTAKGFGFVMTEGEEDIFIPELATKGALHGDKVKVKLQKRADIIGKKREGIIVEILDRANEEVVGTFAKSKNFGFVIADNQKLGSDIFIPKEYTKGAVTGHKVVVKLTSYGNANKNPEGKVIEILGHINDPGVDILSVIKGYNLKTQFPNQVLQQIKNIPDEINSKDIAGRLDLRKEKMVTIDGEDAKDLDDAVSISKEGDIYKLGVHIADVSHYVTENSALDKEALKRGTSVYLIDRVIPMLPPKLSNGICSLNAGVDRLALSCLMEVDKKGNVIGHKIAETVIRVTKRLSYEGVKKILEDKEEKERKEYLELIPMLETMEELANILREKRKKRGSIDFDFPESKIILDEKGKPIDVKPYERNTATKIIEDFMLLANETVAEDYFWQDIPFLYRSHEKPDTEKIKKLSIFIQNFGYNIKLGQEEIHPKELQKLLLKIEGKPEEALISRLTLRSMKRASYTVTNSGHFGLSTKHYCHFTSPIRRYPDLQIHRIIKENLKKGLNEKRITHYSQILPEVAIQASTTERKADEAEREVEKIKKAEYMEQFLGKAAEGIISGMTAWGLFVELPNTVEGMIRVTSLWDDYYYYDEENYMMVGEDTKKVYKLGQKIKVIVSQIDKQLGTIEFEVAY